MVHSDPVDGGEVKADEHGTVVFTFVVPAGFETGAHTATLTGKLSGKVAEAGFTVLADSPTTGQPVVQAPIAQAQTGGSVSTGDGSVWLAWALAALLSVAAVAVRGRQTGARRGVS